MNADKELITRNIRRRLNRIEGQLKGIQRMLDKESCCMDLLIQISAVRGAISKVGMMILENHVKECLKESLQGDNMIKEQTLEELMKALNNFIR